MAASLRCSVIAPESLAIVQLGRALQVRPGHLEPSHLRFVAGKVELNRRVSWMQARRSRQNRVGRVN